MTFDMGGFLGGIIGAWGAYYAARHSFQLDEKNRRQPMLQKKRVEVSSAVHSILVNSVMYILDVSEKKETPETLDQFFDKHSGLFVVPVQKLLAEAFEAGSEMYRIVHDVRVGVSDAFQRCWEAARDEGIKTTSPESKKYIIPLAYDLLNILAEARVQNQEILNATAKKLLDSAYER